MRVTFTTNELTQKLVHYQTLFPKRVLLNYESYHINLSCNITAPHGPWLKSDVPTIIGLGVGMSIFMALTCLVLKLFSRARFAQEQRARGYGNAHLAPAGSLTTHQSNNAHSGST